jgi:hypothetical protein
MATTQKRAQRTETSNVPAIIEERNTALEIPQGMADMFAADAGGGLENTSPSDFALPFIYLLQDLSPQTKERNDKYVPGAKPGLFLNSVTGELYESLIVIPAEFEKVYNEWIPRDQGGGFVGSYKSREDAEKNQRENTQIVDTANHYVLVQGADGEWSPAILSLTSTKLGASRNWLSRIAQRMITTPHGRKPAPSFSGIYEVTSHVTKNQKGEFFVIRINPLPGQEGWVTDPAVYEQAKDFRAQLKAGTKGADFNTTVEAEVLDTDDDDEPRFDEPHR